MRVQPLNIVLVIMVSVGIAPLRAAEPTTAPATHYPGIPVVRLWPDDPAATQPADGAEPGETLKIGAGPRPSVSVRGVTRAAMSVFLPKSPGRPTAAVILCAGGGYVSESIATSGFWVARRLNAEGVAGFVLKYRLPPSTAPSEALPGDALPAPQQDLLRAIQVVRAHAAEWNVDPARVGVMGFSSGGHLVGTAATLFAEAKTLPATDAVARQSARPDFAVMVYPVQSLDPQFGRHGTGVRLIGENPPEALWKRMSVDRNLTTATPPLFIVHAKDDPEVPYQSSQRLADAAQQAGVIHELLLLESGGHGFGLGKSADTRIWFPKCMEWLRSQKLIDEKP